MYKILTRYADFNKVSQLVNNKPITLTTCSKSDSSVAVYMIMVPELKKMFFYHKLVGWRCSLT